MALGAVPLVWFRIIVSWWLVAAFAAKTRSAEPGVGLGVPRGGQELPPVTNDRRDASVLCKGKCCPFFRGHVFPTIS
jgi:hypothetical protein